MPTQLVVPDNLTMESFTDVVHIANGSNAIVYKALFNHQPVIVKMISEAAQFLPVAIHEFDVEHGMLVRFNHPNIIKMLGAGCVPRRFIVLEVLATTLHTVLTENPWKESGLFTKYQPSFPFPVLIARARDLADAFDYLHRACCVGASVIHRDLKPDNVGFAADGTLKLFDLGLCTAVRRRQSDETAYEMTGNTGSLRYMAPEVAMREPYTEKVDVYSWAILVWQMATDQVPFRGLSHETFNLQVVARGERPRIDRTWPRTFQALLQACWEGDPRQRPTFFAVVQYLDKIQSAIKPRR
jgi:serine/threonine protein kinase